MADKELNDTNMGKLTHIGNELLNYSTVEDPAAYRGGAPSGQRSLVKFSGDVLNNGKGQEVVLMQFKQSGDNVPDGQRGGEFYLGLAKPGEGSTDEAMLDVLVATPAGFQFKVPIFAPNLGGGGGGQVDTMWSPNGESFTQQQSDGNFVTYKTSVPFSKASDHVKAVWSAWTGKIG